MVINQNLKYKIMAKEKSQATLLKEKKYFENVLEKARREIHLQKTLQTIAKQGMKEVQSALKKRK